MKYFHILESWKNTQKISILSPIYKIVPVSYFKCENQIIN